MLHQKVRLHANEILWILLISLAFMSQAQAIEQNKKLWVSATLQKPLSSDTHWQYRLYSQLRMIDKSHPWQSIFLDGSLGYAFSPDSSLWIGYNWFGNNPGNRFFQTNRLFEQWVLRSPLQRSVLITRNRLEQSVRSTDQKVLWRLRERVTLLLPRAISHHISPLIYEEGFFQLNRTRYTSTKTFSENRAFLGFQWQYKPHFFWEIGYINQYLFHGSSDSQNQMNHILSVDYNLM